jgi:hypothetical protein
VPAGVAIALAPPLALVGEGRPVVAGVVSAFVFAVGALAQQDTPTGRLVGALATVLIPVPRSSEPSLGNDPSAAT